MTRYVRDGENESWESFDIFISVNEPSKVKKIPFLYHESFEALGGAKKLDGGTIFWDKYENQIYRLWFHLMQGRGKRGGGHIIWNRYLNRVNMSIKEGIVTSIYGSSLEQKEWGLDIVGPRALTSEEPQKLEEMLDIIEPWVNKVIESGNKQKITKANPPLLN